jgi:Domain of unknown function (DUF4037)
LIVPIHHEAPPMPEFIAGLKLCQMFYREAVGPLLAQHAPDLRYAAALIGPGSEVLGFNDPMSTDHHWGPRLILFVTDQQITRDDELKQMLRHKLPHQFRGWPTNFSEPDPRDKGVQQLQSTESGPVNHRVEIQTLGGFIEGYLGIDAARILDDQLTAADWLSLPSQKLLSLTTGAVYHDGVGELTKLRETLAYYPRDVWLYQLAAGWMRISQEEHFVGRTGYVGDDLGSRLICARLVHDMMNLCFLMHKRYPPYSKWFGTAFAQLPCAAELTPIFTPAIRAQDWKQRESHLCRAYRILAAMHNALRITEKLAEQPTPFHGRPFMVIFGERFAKAIAAQIRDDGVKKLADKRPIGGIDIFSTSTDLRDNATLRQALARLYRQTPNDEPRGES